MNRSYKNDLIQLKSYNNKKKILYSVIIKDRSILKGVRFIEDDNKICVDYIPRNIKKNNIENVNKIQKGDILIKINNICIQSLDIFTKLVDKPNLNLTFLNPKLYKKQFKLLNNTNDSKLIRQQYYKYQLNLELIEKNYYSKKIQQLYRFYLIKKRKKEFIYNQIQDLSTRYVNVQIIKGIKYYLNSVKLAFLIKKLYFSKLFRDKQHLQNETDILKSINNLNQVNIESLKYNNFEKDEQLFNSENRYRIKCRSLSCKYSKDKLELDETYRNELDIQWKKFEQHREQENLNILKTGIILENKSKKYIFKLNNNNIELVNCKNNKISKYTFDQIKYILAKNNDSIIIINNKFKTEYLVENKYRNLIVNYFNTNIST